MSQSVTSAVSKKSYRKEAIVAIAAVGIAIIVWNFKDTFSDFWNSLGFSCSSNLTPVSENEKSSAEVAKSAAETVESPIHKTVDVAPESVNGKITAEKSENHGIKLTEKPPKEIVGNSAPESTEKPTTSVYVGLPKADPATVSASITPSQWPGATPL